MLKRIAIAALLLVVPFRAFADEPNPTCTAIQKVIESGRGKFKDLRGKAGEDFSFASTLVIPGMNKCLIAGPANSSGPAAFKCGMKLAGDDTDEAVFTAKADELFRGCLDPASWGMETGESGFRFYNTDPALPRIEAILHRKSAGESVNAMEVKFVAAPPPRIVETKAFCKALEGFVKGSVTNFDELHVDTTPLPGTASCKLYTSPKKPSGVECSVYDGNSLEVSTSSYRYFVQTIARCLPEVQWTSSGDDKNAYFKFRAESGPTPWIWVHRKEIDATRAMRQTGFTMEGVTVSIGLPDAARDDAAP